MNKYLVFVILWLGYFTASISRKSLSTGNTELLAEFHFEKTDLGMLSTGFAFTFTGAKILSGIVVDQTSASRLFAGGLAVVCVCMLGFAGSTSLGMMFVLWTVLGVTQGMAWPPVARLLTAWFEKQERGTWWAATSMSQNVANASMFFLGPWLVAHYGWRSTMLLPGALAAAIALLALVFVRDSPAQDPTAPRASGSESPAARMQQQEQRASEAGPQQKAPTALENFRHVFSQPPIVAISIVGLLLYIIRSGLFDWGTSYLIEQKRFSASTAGAVFSWFEVGGLIGGIACGRISDKFMRGRRIPVIFGFLLGMTVCLAVFFLSPSLALYKGLSQATLEDEVLHSIAIFLSGFFFYGPQTMNGMTCVELAGGERAGSALSVLGTFSGLGLAVGGYPLAYVTERFAWDGLAYMLISSGLLSVLLILPFLKAEKVKVD